ncbi:MAG: Na/Pi symporter [Chlamydiota bacterium]
MNSLAHFLAGFAFFLVGIKLFSAGLNQLTSHRFREIIARFTPNEWVAAFWGIILSLLTAGNTILTPCIAASLVTAQVLSLRKAVWMIIWSRVGACAYVYIAGFNIELAILMMLGMAGISYAFHKPRRTEMLASSIFYLGLVLFGIQLIKSSTKILLQYDWFQEVIHYAVIYPGVAFIAGLLFTLFSQSLLGAMVVALSFLHAEIFHVEQAVLFVLGIYLGTALLRIIYLPAFSREFRKILAIIPIFYCTAFIIGLIAFFIEKNFQIPILIKVANIFSPTPGYHFAHINLMIQFSTAIVLTLAAKPLTRFISTLGVSEEEAGAAIVPVAIPKQIIDDPVSTMEVIENENKRLLGYYPRFFENLRSGASIETPTVQNILHNQLKTNLKAIKAAFVNLLNNAHYNENISTMLLARIERHNLMLSLESNIYQFGETFDTIRLNHKDNPRLVDKLLGFVEASDTILLSLIDVFRQPNDKFNIQTLHKITGEREDLLHKLRKDFSQDLRPEESLHLVSLINLFESNIWIMKKIALLHWESNKNANV